jgi:hypothetical protein
MVPGSDPPHELSGGPDNAAPGYAGPPAALRSRLLSRRAALAGVAPVGALAGLGVTRAASLADKVTASQPAKPAPGQGLNVRSFGAKGDGTADDAPAFQAALNQARSSGIGLVIVPPGTYNINATLTAQAPIRITGLTGWSDTTVVFASALATGILFGQPTTAVVYPGPAMQLTDIGIEYGGTGNAVQFNESGLSSPFQDTMVNGCRFYLTGSGVGLYTVNQRDAIITNCQFLGPGAHSATGIQLSDSDNTKIVDNVFYHLMYCIRGIRSANRTYDAGCVIVGNSMAGFIEGLYFDGWELIQAVGNIIDGGTQHTLYLLDCYHSIIADNYIGVSSTLPGVIIETQNPYGVGFLGQIIFRGNYLNDYEGTAGESAIAVIGASATLPEDQITIEGNILNGYPDAGGIYLHNAQNVIVSMNTLNRASPTSTGVVSILDDTPGSNYIFNNVIDAPIQASGDYVENNFPRKPYPS